MRNSEHHLVMVLIWAEVKGEYGLSSNKRRVLENHIFLRLLGGEGRIALYHVDL